MKTVKVKLDTIDKVKQFVAITSKYPYSLDIASGRYIADAKSIMGIFSFDLTRALELYVHGGEDKDIDEFIESVNQFIE